MQEVVTLVRSAASPCSSPRSVDENTVKMITLYSRMPKMAARNSTS